MQCTCSGESQLNSARFRIAQICIQKIGCTRTTCNQRNAVYTGGHFVCTNFSLILASVFNILITRTKYFIILFPPNSLNTFLKIYIVILFNQTRPQAHVHNKVQERKQDLAIHVAVKKKTTSSHSLPLFKGSMYIEECGVHMLDNV